MVSIAKNFIDSLIRKVYSVPRSMIHQCIRLQETKACVKIWTHP